MSATAVYEALNDAIQDGGGSIDLYTTATQNDALTPLVPVLALFGITSSYILTNAQVAQEDTAVNFNGSGSFGEPNSEPANQYSITANLNYVENESDGVFTLAFIVNDTNWMFSTFFSDLPQSKVYENINNTVWAQSFLTNLTLSSVTFTARSGEDQQLQLEGFLQDNELFDPYAYLVGPWPLRAKGPVTMPTSEIPYPLMELKALPGAGKSTILTNNMPDITGSPQGPSDLPLTNIGLNLSIRDGLDPEIWGRTAFSTLELIGNLTIGTLKADLSGHLLASETLWALSAQFDPETAGVVEGISQLTTLFGMPTLPLPDNFPLLSLFKFKDIQLYISLPKTASGGVQIHNLSLTIDSKEKWTPPISFISFSDVGTRWVWSWSTYFDENNVEVTRSMVTGSVFGTIIFGDEDNTLLLEEGDPKDPRSGSGSQLELEEDTSNAVHVDVSLSLPSLYISAQMRQGDYIPIGDAFTNYFSGPVPPVPSNMNITTFQVTADYINQYYTANAQIIFGDPSSDEAYEGWTIDLGLVEINLQELDFYIEVNHGLVGGGISGEFLLIQGEDPSDEDPRMLVKAEYPVQDPSSAVGWVFSGYLFPGTSIDVVALVTKFLGISETSAPVDLSIDALSVSFNTGSQDYAFMGTISTRWTPTIFGTELKVNASASIDLKKTGNDNTKGTLSGEFSINNISLSASMDVGVTETTYQFKVQFDQLWLQATTAWRGEEGNRHQVISLQLGGVTLGDILEYLVNLAAPTLGFSLDSPWDVLKQIDLSQFVLTIDPQENVVEFVFNTNVDLVIAQLNSIGVRYSKPGNEGKVDLILTGQFLGQTYDSEDPLSWDVINDPPPSVPGEGLSLIDLRYLGIGQHVTFDGTIPNTVAESVAKLKKTMTPVDTEGYPVPQTMKYSADSEWLIGLDVTIMEAVDFAFIFNDPVLYGLSIGLKGEKVGGLAGLRFEILYKKITDDIGMFRVEFQVPDMFRTIQIGVASVTLGIIVVEIYTNGNFKVDLGFPYNRNFDRSFSLQAYIFIGRGGFYLGVLNGDTSTQVPRISNGNFSPVIELGVGIAAGVGREVKAGILSGGAYVQLEVLFEGVLAWFNPTNNGSSTEMFFKCTGVAAIHGKVYGSVDFKVVKVSVTLEAYAQVVLVYECYQPLLIDLSVDVSAKASVKVLFVKVHFSFHVNLELSFTVGSASPTPWILDSTNGASGGTSAFALKTNKRTVSSGNPSRSYYLRANKHRRKQALQKAYASMHKKLTEEGLFSRNMVDGVEVSEDYLLSWDPSGKVFGDESPKNAHITMLPIFTIGDVPVNWDSTFPTNNDPNYRSAFVLFADTGISADAVTAEDCKKRSAELSAMTTSDEDTSGLAADILVQGLTRYAINALPRAAEQGNDITAAQLETLIEQLELPETLSTGFTIDNLATFFSTNINLWISGDPDSQPDEKGAMIFPMPPFLTWESPQTGRIDFSNENNIGTLYEWGISQFLNNYFTMGIDGTPEPTDDDPSKYESYATFMFRDFCLMMVQSAVKEMQKHMNNTTVTVQEVSGATQTLSEIAAELPQTTVPYAINSGDTVESVAENLGATVEEIEFLNPNLATELVEEPVGTVINIILGIAPEVLAIDNPDKNFAITQCTLGTLVHQAAQDDTLQNIANLFHVGDDGVGDDNEGDVTVMLSYSNPDFPSLTSGTQILNPGSIFSLDSQTFSNTPSDFDQLRTAGVFFIRYYDYSIFEGSAVPDQGNWYAQAISELNDLSSLYTDQNIVSDVELPPGQELTVPSAYNDKSNTNTYTTVNGDTLTRIGLALTLQQDYGTSDSSEGWEGAWNEFRGKVTTAGTNAWTIPESDITIRVAESIESLVRRLIISAVWESAGTSNPSQGSWSYTWSEVQTWISNAQILTPLASITVPDAKASQDDPLSFTILAKVYGLSIVDAAARLKNDSLYEEGSVLNVTLLPAQDIDVLLDLIIQGDSFASIVNQSSRMLMSGSQLPDLKDENGHVVPDLENLKPLYDLTKQQFDVPVDDTQPSEVALSLQLTSDVSWIVLMESITTQDKDTLESLQSVYPNMLEYNPGLTEETLKSGIIILTEPVESTLDYSYTNEQVKNESPEAGLSVIPYPAGETAPKALPLSATVIKTYGLEKSIEIQTPIALPIPEEGQANISGNPTLWPFPPDMIQKAMNTTPEELKPTYEILYTKTGGEAGAESIVIEDSTYGMLLPFKIKRLEDTSTNEFSLIGVDTDNRNTLIALINWLNEQNDANDENDDEDEEKTEAYMLVSPAPNATNTSGLSMISDQATDIYLIKSNLSTESVPPPNNGSRSVKEDEGEDDDESPYFATMSSLAKFATLLWEGSVVGGTGYYFGTTKDLPSSAFDEQGNITLQLLVIAKGQQDPPQDGRSLLPFNNCALIGPGVDNSLQTLYMESADSTSEGETTVQAVVPPGNVGFELLLESPDKIAESGSITDQQKQIMDLYSLLCFEVALSASPFYAEASGMPVLPTPSDGSDETNVEKARNVRNAKQFNVETKNTDEDIEPYQSYQQVLPVSNFVREYDPDDPNTVKEAAPRVDGLPSPDNDPYYGYGTWDGNSLPSGSFVFGFGDILGNRTGQTASGQGATEIFVGYTDNIVGISEWPSIASYFEVDPDPDGSGDAIVTVVLRARPSELLPTPSQRGDVNADNLSQQSQKYSEVYYQLIQSEIQAWLVTSLKVVDNDNNGENQGIELDSIAPLYQFAAGSYANVNSIALFTPTKPEGTDTLAEMVNTYGVRYVEIGLANADSDVLELFGSTTPTVPGYYPFVEYQSISGLYNMPPKGWPKPASAEDLLTDPENTSLLLRVGILLTIDTEDKIDTGSSEPTKSLQELSDEKLTDPISVAVENQSSPNLKDGFEFNIEVSGDQYIAITVDSTLNSLSLVRDQFINEGVNVTVDELAQLYKDEEDMFAVNQELDYTTYIVQENDTLATNQSGFTADDLASLNVNTKNIFDPGALVYFGSFSGVTVEDQTTLQEFADRYACSLELLLKANESVTLPDTSAFVVPGTISWPETTDTLRTPYTISSSDTLNIIANKFSKSNGTGDANDLLAALNENMPNTILSNIDLTINVAGTNYTVNTGNDDPSFASVLETLQEQIPSATLDDIVSSIGDETGVLNPSGLFICPPAQFSEDTQPENIEGIYGINASTFALGNAAMLNIIKPDITLSAADGTTITTQTNDTFNSLITSFADNGAQVDIPEIVNVNGSVAFIQSGALALLPSSQIRLSVDIGTGGPYAEPIVPLTTSIRISRPDQLVYTDFKDGPVEMVESLIPAPTGNENTENGGLNFNDFVEKMKEALPNLRIGTGQVEGVSQDLWIVNFDSNGIESVDLIGETTVSDQKQPRFFALSPLYNSLVSRQNIPIKPLEDDGTLGEEEYISFQSIDTEVWARKFVEDFDRFLEGTYAIALYKNQDMQAYLTQVLDAKKKLIKSISYGLTPVLDVPDTDNADDALTSAEKALRQQLGVSLSRTYETTVMIQYNSNVESIWQTDSDLLPASLYGDGVIDGDIKGISILSAKTSLNEANSFVNFLLTLDNPSLHRNIPGSFKYDISNLEFNISNPDVQENYNASDWLTFVPLQKGTEKPNALVGTDPGDVDVPIPLRLFPDLPILKGQSASQEVTEEASSVGQLSLWEYDYVYSHEHAAQDYVIITAEFNLKSLQAKSMVDTDDKDLFTELAQYNTVATKLWDNLTALTNEEVEVDPDTLVNSVKTYADIITSVSNCWTDRDEEANDSGTSAGEDNLVALLSYSFEARVDYDNNTYTLKLNDSSPGPNDAWPEVYLQKLDGTYEQFQKGTAEDGEMIYTAPDGTEIPYTYWPVFKIVWTDLNVAQVQNARSQMLVERNQELIDDVKTNDAFIFSTAPIVAPSVVTPLNNYSDRLLINELGSNLTDALNATFDALFGSEAIGQIITMELSYGFELVASESSSEALVTYLPIGLYPNQVISDKTAGDLNDAINAWKLANKPSEQGGEWVFSLKMYSQMTSDTQVLLSIDHLVYQLT